MRSLLGGRVVLLGALVAALVAGRGDAARVVSRPPGTPDLAAMAIRGSDLPGARVTRQGYVKPATSFVASYQRTLELLAFGPTRLIGVQSEVDLARSSADARLYVSLTPLVVLLFDPKKLARSFASTTGIHPTHVGISKARRIRAGDQGYEATVTIRTKFDEIRNFLVVVQVNRVVDIVFAVAVPNAAVGLREAGVLARLTAAHTHDGLLPINTSPPVVTGTAAPGGTLTAVPGVWSNKPSSFTYAWQRCDAAGAACTDTGARGPTYSVATADAGATLRVSVTATNALGSGHAVSAATPIVPGLPVSTAPPTIAGTPAVGQPLTATTGTWTGSPTTFAYQWQRCDQAGAGCSDIAGATTVTYTVTGADIGSTLRVTVTATNASGSVVAVSAPTAVVAG